MRIVRLLSLLIALGVPGLALAVEEADAEVDPATEEPPADPPATEEASAEEPPAETAPDEGPPVGEVLDDGTGPSVTDVLTERMLAVVSGYYAGVGQQPTRTEIDSGVESIRLMLLDGVSLSRIADAAEEAIRLHTPGRRVPFEVAVPLRIRPDVSDGDSLLSAPGLTTQAPIVDSERPDELPEITPLSPEEEARLLADRQARSAKRARIRLFRQWQERTKPRRSLIGAGVASWASGYAIGFAHAGVLALNGAVPHYSAWVTAVPLAGNITLAVWTLGAYPVAIVCAIAEWAGVALVIAGVAHKVDWPYKRDPTAMRSPTRPRVTIVLVPTGAGGALVGRW